MSASKSTNEQLNVRKDFEWMVSGLGLRKFQKDIISEVINDECLKRKARASIFFDRIFSIYGVNSQEAGAFESAVVTGTSDFAIKQFKKEGVDCKFSIVKNRAEGFNEIRKLLDDPEYLKLKSRQCFTYVKKVHSGKETIKRLLKIIGE